MSIYLLIPIYVLLSYLASTGWKNRNLNQMYGFLLGLFTSPPGSYIICLALKENRYKIKEEILEEVRQNLDRFDKTLETFTKGEDDEEDEEDDEEDDE